MTSRERLTAVLRGREPDRIPWSPCMDTYFTNSVMINGKHPDLADAARLMGADHMERHVGVYDVKHKNVEHNLTKKGSEELESFITPVGKLEQVFTYSEGVKWYKGNMVNTLEDLKTLKYIVENTRYELNPSCFLQREAYIGEDGLATVDANTTPIKWMMDLYTGLESFTYLLYDYKEEIMELMEMIHSSSLELLKVVIESPAEFIFSYEDTSTTVLSRSWYSEYCSPYINQYADMIHKAGKVYITHMCGKLKGFTDLIKADTMDGIDSVCPPTTGDLWAHEALAAFNGKIVIGGLEPSALQRMTAEETEEYVINVLKAVAPGNNFILSTGDAVAFGTPFENMRKVGEVIKKYGGYPMKF